MVEYWVAYFSIGDSRVEHLFECIPPGPIGLLRDQVIRRGGGREDVYIRWHHRLVEQIKLHLMACTPTELTIHEVREVVLQAVKFAEEQCK